MALLKWRSAGLFAVAALMFGAGGLRGQPLGSKEYQIKAVFLFNFVQFVEWPAAALPPAGVPFRIGILGDDPFGAALEQTVRGETVRNRPLIVQRAQKADDLKGCQVVFVSKSEQERVPDILLRFERSAVLTVGDMEGFARRGGVINFYLDGNKVRFEINPTIAQQHNLKMSSQLLSLAKIVGPAREGGQE